jgi:hypothetical protein
LPLLPGIKELDYRTILDYLASGVDNLGRLYAHVEGTRAKMTRSMATPDHVGFIEDLARLTKAFETLGRHLRTPLVTVGEAKALFIGAHGIDIIAKGIRDDLKLDSSFRVFALAELGALLSSVRFSGGKQARSIAYRLSRKQIHSLRRASKMPARLSGLYCHYGRQAWVRE